jgi:uncharacterized lipoprotein YddW (UPF0748 family)
MPSTPFGRRKFLAHTAGGAALAATKILVGARTAGATKARELTKGMKLAMAVSYDDEVNTSKQQEQQLIDRVFGQLQDAGFHAVVWRSMRGGQAMFKSSEYKISYPTNLAGFDPLAAAQKKARQMGLEFFVWHEVKGAEAHGWLLHSAFVKEHPELLSTNRMKMTSKSELSWAAPEVMRRRVATFKEVLAYEPDAIWLDHIKGGDVSVPNFDADGCYAMGYDKYMVEAFQTKTGRDPWQIPNQDPQWLAFRASYMTEYMRRIRQAQQEAYPQVKLGSLGASIGYTHSCWYLPLENDNSPNMSKTARLASPLANLEDHDTWTREGLIDGLCAPFNTFAAAEELKTILPNARSHIQGPCMFAVCLGMAKPPAAILDCARVAYEHDAEYLFVRESYDIRDKPDAWDAFKQVSQRYS